MNRRRKMFEDDCNGKPVKVTDANFDNFIRGNQIVLIDFWADWCYPCRMLSPILDSLSKEFHAVAFGKLNVDENRQTAMQYDIMSIPTLLYFKNGELVDRTVGVLPKNHLEDKLRNLIQ